MAFAINVNGRTYSVDVDGAASGARAKARVRC